MVVSENLRLKLGQTPATSPSAAGAVDIIRVKFRVSLTHRTAVEQGREGGTYTDY